MFAVIGVAASQSRAPAPAAWFATARWAAPTGNIFTPASYGGDPTGKFDSTLAVQAALDAAATVAVPGAFIGNGTNHAGATVHLQGGEFLVSGALWVGKGGGIRVCCGALRAAPSFPPNSLS